HLGEPENVTRGIFQKLAHATVGIAGDRNKYRPAFMRRTGVDALAVVPDNIIAEESELEFVNLGPVVGAKSLAAEVGGFIERVAQYHREGIGHRGLESFRD